jgi:predicted amidophosphoribosyltransferase
MSPEREHNSGNADRFVWPPKSVGASMADPIEPTKVTAPSQVVLTEPSAREELRSTSRTRHLSSPHHWLTEIEHFWLDTTAASLDIRREETSWNPDEPSAYCPRCAHTLKPGEIIAQGCGQCAGTRPPWDRIIRLGQYTQPLRSWVQEVKFGRFRQLGFDLGTLLGEAVRVQIENDQELFARTNSPLVVGVVPVPTTLWRRLTRGIDHTRTIAKAAARALEVPRIRPRVMQPIRREHRPSQLEVLPSERQANVARAFSARRPGQGLGCRLVIVVDDVATTGATIRAACRAVRQACSENERVSIWVAVLAQTPAKISDRDE